jgi:hypothetical protein
MFSVGCCVVLVVWQPPKATMYFISIIFVAQLDCLNNGQKLPRTRSATGVSSQTLPPPTLSFGWLLRQIADWQPPKAWSPPFSLFCDRSPFGSSSKGTSRGDCIPATGRLLWTYGEPRCHDLRAPLPYPWERGPSSWGVGWRCLMLVFVCVVCYILWFEQV